MSVKNEPAIAASELQSILEKELPAWRLEDGWIKRTYKTNSWKGTMMAVATVGHLAEAAWHHPDITLSYAWLEVRLMTHSAKGVTRKDLELARKIEEVLLWQPAANPDSALDGTPATDLRFSYMKYE